MENLDHKTPVRMESEANRDDLIRKIGVFADRIRRGERVMGKMQNPDDQTVFGREVIKMGEQMRGNLIHSKDTMIDTEYETLKKTVDEFEKLQITQDHLKQLLDAAYGDLDKVPDGDEHDFERGDIEKYITGLEYLIKN